MTKESDANQPSEQEPVAAVEEEPTAPPARRRVLYRSPEVVEVFTGRSWQRAIYGAYFDQYDIHEARFSDGTVWQGGSDEIRALEGDPNDGMDRGA